MTSDAMLRALLVGLGALGLVAAASPSFTSTPMYHFNINGQVSDGVYICMYR